MKRERINVLLIEDNPADARLIEESLKDAQVKVNLTVADCLSAGIERLAGSKIDVVLLDLGLPESTGLDTYRMLREKFPDIAIVVLTGLDDYEVATTAVREGAQDYLVKGHVDPNPLARSIRYAYDRKQAEAALRLSEEKYRLLFAANLAGVYRSTPDGKIVECNEAMAKMLGYRSPEELIGVKTPATYADPTEREIMLAQLEQRKSLRNYEIRLRTKSGETIWCLMNVVLLTEGDQGVLQGNLVDITERREAENALRESEERYRALVEHNLAGVWRVTLDGRILECNQALARILGYANPGEVLQRTAFDHYHDRADRDKLAVALKERGFVSDYEVPMRRKDGQQIWCMHNAVLVEDREKPSTIINTIVDITERKQVIEKLRMLARIAEQVGEGVALATLDGEITFANTAWAKMHGFEADEIIGKHLSIFHTKEQLLEVKRFNEAVLRDGISEGEVGHVTRDGVPFDTYMTTTLLKDEKGDAIGFIGVVRDITEKKRTEAALEQYRQELALRNMLSEIFLTKEDEEMYASVMETIHQTLDSQFGFFGYIDEAGSLVGASLTRSVWDECQMPGKSLVFPPETWGGLWGQALKEKRTFWANEGLKMPEGHVQLECAIATPIMNGPKLVGLFVVGNKEGGYDQDDVKLLETLAAHIAPVLDARLERNRREKQLHYRLQIEEAVAKVSREFTRADGADLNVVLETLGAAVSVDRAYIFRLREGTIGDNTHESCRPGTASQLEQMQDFNLTQFPWALAEFQAGRSVAVADTLQPPEGVEIESEWELSMGVRAVAVMPVRSPLGELEGLLGFDVEGGPREWRPEDIQALQIVAEMLSSYWARERAEMGIAQVATELRELIDTANAPILGVDTNGLVNEWNQKAAELTGYSQDDALGLSLLEDLVELEHKNAVNRVLYDAVVGIPTSNFEFPMKTKSGKHVLLMLNATPRRNTNGEIVGVLGVGQDITELVEYREGLERKVEERTQELETVLHDTSEGRDRIDAILKSVADGLIVTDMYNRVVLMNRAAEELLDTRLSEAIGLTVDFAIDDATLRDRLRSTLDKREEGYEFDFVLPGAAGVEKRILSARTSLVRDRSGEITGIVTIIHDVSREREMDRMKTEFVSTAAHELRTPLTSIQGFSEILLTREDLPGDKQKKYLGYINHEAVALANIINDLLDISRIESGKGFSLVKKHCDVAEMFGRLVAVYRDRHPTHGFVTEFPDEPLRMFVDPDKMHQVLDNLLSNSVKYSPDGGTITVGAREVNGETEITVTDEGMGMTPEQETRIFDKFYRADASNTAIEGTGLGMTIVKYIIEAHGGTVHVESEPGKGTVVTVILPRS